jgi:nicotinamide mononucleotide transporter
MTDLKLVINYIAQNYIELLATITGIIYLVLSIPGKKLLWLFGLLTSLLYVYVFFKSKIYADMGINVYYVIISVYGWILWSSNKDKGNLPFSRLKLTQSVILLILTAVLFVLIAFILKKFTDSDVAWFDAFTTAASITATWMLARKILEHWLIWVVVDGMSIGLYIYKGLYPTVLLFVFYTVLAVLGFYEWLKLWRTQESKLHVSY